MTKTSDSTLPLSSIPAGWKFSELTFRYWVATSSPDQQWSAMLRSFEGEIVRASGYDPYEATLSAIGKILYP